MCACCGFSLFEILVSDCSQEFSISVTFAHSVSTGGTANPRTIEIVKPCLASISSDRASWTEAHIVTDTHARCVGFLRAECALFVRSCPASPSRGAHSWREQVHAHGVDVAREVGLSGGLDHTVPSSPEEGHVVGVRPQHRRVLGVKHVVAAALAALLWRRRVLLDHHEPA